MKRIYGVMVLFLSFLSFEGNAQQLHKLSVEELIKRQLISETHTVDFEKLQIQDFQGRIKPVHTLALDLLRKIHGKSSFKYIDNKGEKRKLTATQVFLGMHFKPDSWQLLPLIKIDVKTKSEIEKLINKTKNGYAKPSQFFDFNGNYLLKDKVASAYATAEGKRNVYEKSIIKLDERLNITWAIFNGQFLRLFPNPLNADKKWFSPKEKTSFSDKDDQTFFDKIVPTYFGQLQEGITSNKWIQANETISMIKAFQQKNAFNLLIPDSKVGWEVFYNKKAIFFTCMIFYTLIGVLLLIGAFMAIFSDKKWISIVNKIVLITLLLVFLYHGFGIVLRWYISGHAPWSNGYEATVFISWIGMLAGLFFSKKTKFPAAAMALISVCLLGIAHGNLMNPEITNLVPVLKSYWLMIHVAIITGSYGFLTMGSILALVVLINMILISDKRKDKFLETIKELTKINETTIAIGLFMLTIGTFLGGVWANESWGRYWGWDPKETWALISVTIYAFILHVKIIFKKNFFVVFNISALFGLSSLIMTFFGVNYYLSGLHSYAKGDPVPIPTWIYVVIPVLIIISFIASYRFKRLVKD